MTSNLEDIDKLSGSLDDETLAEVCARASADTGSTVVVANRNCPGQTVISGAVQALELASELANERGAKRVARLNISICLKE